MRWADWSVLAGRQPVADAAVITTPDREHVAPSIALAEAGYALLVEKPMATDPGSAEHLVEVVERTGVLFAVCHVLRYTPYTRAVVDLLASGVLGHVHAVEHLEPIGWWHFVHSYVRGSWRREDTSGPLLLTKSCHDLDWLDHVLGRPVLSVSSFGRLSHFRPKSAPPGATARCLDCPVEATCPYSAPRFYLGLLDDPGSREWPLRVLTDDPTRGSLLAALRTGPYGRCVYACDNDVVDHQVVALEYDGGTTVSFTLTAFTPSEHRRTTFFGSHGSLRGDGRHVTVTDFRDGSSRVVDTGAAGGATADSGHGGGDDALVEAFLTALRTGDRSAIPTGARDSLRAHRVAWAAERSRRTGQVVNAE
jgi:predicted dehydrogenase